VPQLPLTTAMNAAMNPVNSLPFTLPTSSAAGGFATTTTAPPGYVLYNGLKSRRNIDSYGNERWSITHRFLWRNLPWGFAANPSPSSAFSGSGSGSGMEPFEQLVFISNGNPLYGTSDLNLLLNASAT
jgi:hypothetical protein